MNIVSVPAGVLLSLVCVASAGAADRFDEIRAHIRAGLIEESVPSIAVAVAQDGKIIWEEGFGWADREKRIPANEHTMYSLASISKPITTTGLMVLVQSGKVDLDKPANDYLGKAKLVARIGDAREATVRRVANHTSGLPLHAQFFYADESIQRPSMDETILRYGNLITPPGESYEYSNLGFGVLDYIMERASGMSYAQFMRNEVFLPLGLTHMSVDIGSGLEGFAATRYGEDGLPIPFYDFDHPGASAVFGSAHDLVRFGMFHLKAHLRDQKAILTDASIDEMHRRTAGDESKGYGVGFDVSMKQGYRVVSHTGGMGGVGTSMQLYPDQKLAIVVLANAGVSLPHNIASRIAAKMLPKWKFTPRGEWPPTPPFVTPAELVGTWKGTLATYSKDLPVELTFEPDGDVHAKVADQLTTLVSGARFKDGIFRGELNAQIASPDNLHFPYTVTLKLTLRGDVMNGGASVMGSDIPRVRNAVTQWLEVKKEKPLSANLSTAQ